jgi:hypothetical protein
MKTNKKVLIILLALTGAQSSVLAKKSNNCKTFGKSPEITVCVEMQTPNDKLNREQYAKIKSTAQDLLAKQKKALKKPKAMLAPTMAGELTTSQSTIFTLPEVFINEPSISNNNNNIIITEPNINEPVINNEANINISDPVINKPVVNTSSDPLYSF